MPERYKIEAKFDQGANPEHPGPWTRTTLESAMRFADHNIRDRAGEGILSLKVSELQADNETWLPVYTVQRAFSQRTLMPKSWGIR